MCRSTPEKSKGRRWPSLYSVDGVANCTQPKEQYFSLCTLLLTHYPRCRNLFLAVLPIRCSCNCWEPHVSRCSQRVQQLQKVAKLQKLKVIRLSQDPTTSLLKVPDKNIHFDCSCYPTEFPGLRRTPCFFGESAGIPKVATKATMLVLPITPNRLCRKKPLPIYPQAPRPKKESHNPWAVN